MYRSSLLPNICVYHEDRKKRDNLLPVLHSYLIIISAQRSVNCKSLKLWEVVRISNYNIDFYIDLDYENCKITKIIK